MKVKLIVYLCVALSPYKIYAADSSSSSNNPAGRLAIKIEMMARKNRTIADIFKPSMDGYLSEDSTGFTFKGILLRPNQIEVAMKFISTEYDAKEEFAIYTYLNSLDDPNIESYGIPKIHFFGEWNGYMLLALPLLDSRFKKRSEAGLGSGQINVVDILIAFREFVRITKYIHSRGIQHNNIHYGNMMFRLDRGFIVDYGVANQMLGKAGQVLPPKTIAKRRRSVRKDWKTFLFSMCKVAGVKLAWFNESEFDLLNNQVIQELQEDTLSILREISLIQSDPLKIVLKNFAGFALLDRIGSRNEQDKECFYDYFYNLISEVIDKLHVQKPAMFSWLTPDERNEAIQQLKTNPVPPISTIRHPFEVSMFNYPPVDYQYFSEK